MNKSPLKESDYFIAWIIYFFASLFGGAIAGFFGGLIVGATMAAAGALSETIRIGGAIAGFIVGLPVSYLCFRFIVGKFIVQKIQPAPDAPPEGTV